jgi:hypothetical protein
MNIYEPYKDDEFVSAVLTQLSRTNHLLIMAHDCIDAIYSVVLVLLPLYVDYIKRMVYNSPCNFYQMGLSLKGQGSPHLSMMTLCRYVTWPRGDIFLYA